MTPKEYLEAVNIRKKQGKKCPYNIYIKCSPSDQDPVIRSCAMCGAEFTAPNKVTTRCDWCKERATSLYGSE